MRAGIEGIARVGGVSGLVPVHLMQVVTEGNEANKGGELLVQGGGWVGGNGGGGRVGGESGRRLSVGEAAGPAGGGVGRWRRPLGKRRARSETVGGESGRGLQEMGASLPGVPFLRLLGGQVVLGVRVGGLLDFSEPGGALLTGNG